MRLILAMMLVVLGMQEPQLEVRGGRVGGKHYEVVLTYPEGLDRIWTCVIMNRGAEPEYKPRWCWQPIEGTDRVEEGYVIPNWPPVDDGQGSWRMMAFMQFVEFKGQTEGFGYIESEWKEVR